MTLFAAAERVVDICPVVTYAVNMTTRPSRLTTPRRGRKSATTEHSIGIRDLKARLSEYVRRVKGGATIVVTEHGRAVARLVPEPMSLHDRLRALAEAGEVGWNGEPYAPAGPKVRIRGARTLSDLVVAERDRE